MTEREALKLALEALKQIDEAMPFPVAKLAQKVIKEALANETLEKMAENARELGLDYEPAKELCGGCKGSGWVTRDPDIGTDQECFVCGGSGAYPKEPAQEPVAIVDANDEGYWAEILPDRNVKVGQLLYTTPPQRKPLSDEEISDLWCKVSNTDFVTGDTHVFARAIEAAHGIKGEA